MKQPEFIVSSKNKKNSSSQHRYPPEELKMEPQFFDKDSDLSIEMQDEIMDQL